jgi:CheY-like chemotaxis protein
MDKDSADRPHLKGVHVLVVDDNEDARNVLSEYLVHLGATVTTAKSGGEALAVVAQIQAHVIVSDISMPGMTGIELIREVRKLPGQRECPTPAIAFTAFARKQDEREALSSGFDVYRAKPIDPLDLAREIARLLQAAARNGQPRTA